MRKANKELLPQERFLNLLNEMVDDMDWQPFGLYGEDYHFSYSNNPEFPYRLTYTKHGQEFRIDLSDYIIFSEDSGLIEELLDNDFLDIDKFRGEVNFQIDLHYRAERAYMLYSEENVLTWCIYLQREYQDDRLEDFFKYLTEG